MVDIPAVCSTCGALFYAPNLISGGGTVVFRNSALGPCPMCGGGGDIIDGIYNAATNTARLLISPFTKPHQLKKLEQILIAAQKQQLSREQIDEQVKKNVLEFQSVTDWLPKTRSELYAFVGVILTLISLITTSALSIIQFSSNVSELELKGLVDKAIQLQASPKEAKPAGKKKIGRNEPYSCGSGKKHKKCCLGNTEHNK